MEKLKEIMEKANSTLEEGTPLRQVFKEMRVGTEKSIENISSTLMGKQVYISSVQEMIVSTSKDISAEVDKVEQYRSKYPGLFLGCATFGMMVISRPFGKMAALRSGIFTAAGVSAWSYW
eukprot:CAMPEP_0113944942 /NCGR_PEP_ID=MMETSP1339-20121228/38190_1 /TAXON_ID=94617 /ORGANISM="Fibrocapsa japonica" /LENGTH=119 /DNA_ID=CAMNT_0000950319 /DNA_START=72 /DNA_END=428 /DNA_ORIENTATION=- /assembly_acc=CAM_ASM_000762